MKPTDLRNATFQSIRSSLPARRRAVYAAWVRYGMATTHGMSQQSGIPILSLRPRTTELCQLGLVEIVGAGRSTEGTYRAVEEERWNHWRQDQISGQQQLI